MMRKLYTEFQLQPFAGNQYVAIDYDKLPRDANNIEDQGLLRIALMIRGEDNPITALSMNANPCELERIAYELINMARYMRSHDEHADAEFGKSLGLSPDETRVVNALAKLTKRD